MKWSPSQAKAIDAIARWLREPSRKPTFYLDGPAGSGKSTILKHALAEVRGKICYCAPTGKAALVMQRKGCPTARTIHSTIYNVVGGEPPTPEAIQAMRVELARMRAIAEPGAQATADRIEQNIKRAEQDAGRGGRPRFSINPASDLAVAAIGVIDECSMCDHRIGADLESFGVPLLVVGDAGQLPPVYGDGYFTSREPDARLGEIHRQALDSPILYLADKVRRGESLPYGKIGDGDVVEVVRSPLRGGPPLVDRAMDAEMILVGRNATRHATNKRVRSLLGRTAEPSLPVVGDRIVCLRNDHELGLLNGSTWIVDRSVPDLDRMIVKLDVRSTDDGQTVECEAWLHPFMGRDEELVGRHDRRARCEFAFGFAMTVHKSQGSEWRNVLVFDEGNQFGKDAARWRYTAATRAAEKLTWVQ